jgi:hypothetical protein
VRHLPLLRKEARALRGYVGLILLLSLISVLDVLLGGHPDDRLLDNSFELLDSVNVMVVMNFLFAFSLAQGLLSNEIDSGALQWLDGLPTTRTRVYASKMFVAFVVLTLLPVSRAAEALWQHGMSRTSIEPGWHLDLVVTGVGLHALQIALFLAAGVVLSFAHRLAWLIAALAALGLVRLEEEDTAFEIVNPIKLVEPVLDGGTWIVPWSAVGAQLLVLAALVGVGWVLFDGLGVRLLRRLESARNTRLGRFVLLLIGLLTLGGWIAVISALADDDDDGPKATVVEGIDPSNDRRRERFDRIEPRLVVTQHYQLAYPATYERRALLLAQRADEVHEQVRALLGAQPVGSIAVDGTRALSDHGVAGLANWRSARVSLPTLAQLPRLLEVLAHETTHVYVSALTDRKFNKRYRATRWLNEGLSQYVGMRLYGYAAKRDAQRVYAAAMWSYAELDVETLFDDAQLRRRLHPDLVYPLGELFVHALVLECTDGALARILPEYASDDLDDRPNRELARVAFGRAGCDYDAVVNRFVDEIARRKREASEAGAPFEDLPTAQAEVEVVSGRLWARIRTSADDVVCRFRSGPEASEETISTAPMLHSECSTAAARFPRGTVELQLGVRVPSIDGTLWGRWTSFTLDG